MDAQQRFQSIQDHFGGGAVVSPGWIVMFAGVVMVVVSALALRHWWRTRHERPSPTLSFLTLASKLGLSAAEQWLLIRIAGKLKLPTPITLLISPRTLQHHAETYAAQLPRRRSAKLIRRTDAIADKLFGTQGAVT